MKTVGIIAEYNPFHNGHAYHIEQAKQRTNADCAIVIMSGNFVQRGEPAILDKYTRANMALLCGADVVLELPALYATSSAEFFSLGAVLTLEKLQHVDFLCFGSEDGTLQPFLQYASFFLDESASFQKNLSLFLKQGDSFPKARAKALHLEQSSSSFCQNNNDLGDFLLQPNNILGIEYVKTLKKYHCAMEPVTIMRKNVHYHDKSLHSFFSSASAIRTALQENDVSSTLASIPEKCHPLFVSQYQKTFPVFLDDFSHHFAFLFERESNPLCCYLDIKKELANRIESLYDPTLPISDFVTLLKNKSITHTAIQRALLHYILNIKKDFMEEVQRNGGVYYARVLGFTKTGAAFLKEAKKTSQIPLIQQPAKAKKLLDEAGKAMLHLDLRATRLYQTIQYEKFHTPIVEEYKTRVLFLS